MPPNGSSERLLCMTYAQLLAEHRNLLETGPRTPQCSRCRSKAIASESAYFAALDAIDRHLAEVRAAMTQAQFQAAALDRLDMILSLLERRESGD